MSFEDGGGGGIESEAIQNHESQLEAECQANALQISQMPAESLNPLLDWQFVGGRFNRLTTKPQLCMSVKKTGTWIVKTSLVQASWTACCIFILGSSYSYYFFLSTTFHVLSTLAYFKFFLPYWPGAVPLVSDLIPFRQKSLGILDSTSCQALGVLAHMSVSCVNVTCANNWVDRGSKKIVCVKATIFAYIFFQRSIQLVGPM